MYLSKISIDRNRTITQIELEKVANDLLMISVNNNIGDQSAMFSYWRILGSGGNPPLEIGINTNTKSIKSITFFVDTDCFAEFHLLCDSYTEGNIVFNTGIFCKKNDYIDTFGNYTVSLNDDKLLCIFNEQINIKETIVNDSIEYFVNNNDELQGFALNHLGEQEIDAIKSVYKG